MPDTAAGPIPTSGPATSSRPVAAQAAPAGAAALRTTMVDTQVRPADVTRYPIIEAMLFVPREAFVPPGREEAAYMGENLWLGPGRVLLDPRSFAKMLEALDLLPGEAVLHVGAGLGYGTAVMTRLGAQVTALEEDGAWAAGAQDALAREGLNAVVRHGPLTGDGLDLGPFAAILVEGAVEEVPAALLARLAPGGRIVAIFSEAALGTARIGRESGGRVSWRYLFNAGAPVLPGFRRAPSFVL